MGFIDYNGTKENRYLDVVEYAKAQQEENQKKRQVIKVAKWLEELNGMTYLADLYIQEYLKSIIIEYRKMSDFWKIRLSDVKEINDISIERVWIDFLNELVLRHIDSLHIVPEDKEKIFLSFYGKVFKLPRDDIDSSFYESLTDDPEYRKYLAECFDPTWKGQQLYKIIYSLNNLDKDFITEFISFLDEYSLLGLNISLYLNQLFLPRDDGWMIQEKAEWNAILDIKKRILNKSYSLPNKKAFNSSHNSDSSKEQSELEVNNNVEKGDNTSSLDRKIFEEYIKKKDVKSYTEAISLLIRCELPEDIKEKYIILSSRMLALDSSIQEFDEVYHADIEDFIDYYTPETLFITATYLDYLKAAPSEAVLSETKENVLNAVKKLLQVVNEKIDEIYMFVTIETKAKAKALEAIMIQDGYVDPDYKLKQ